MLVNTFLQLFVATRIIGDLARCDDILVSLLFSIMKPLV